MNAHLWRFGNSLRVYRLAGLVGLVSALLMVSLRTMAAQAPDQSQLTAVAHVALRVSDVNAEVQFLKKLGFEQAFTHEQYGRTAFVFVKVSDDEFLEIHPRTPVNATAPLPLGYNHICYATPNANAAYARWAKAGLNPTEVAKGSDGTLEFGVKDPSGAMTEALEIVPDSQPGLDKGQHLGANRISDWLMGIDVPAADVATWRKFYEAMGFIGANDGAAVQMTSPANRNLKVYLHPAGKEDQTRILFSVKSAQKAADHLRAAGLQVEASQQQATVRDPDGNIFVLQEQASYSAPTAASAQAIANPFGKMADGAEAQIYTLKNREGFEAQITNYGATIVSLKTPDRKGRLADVVLGYDDLDGYLHGKGYFGATIGRYGNRIAKGTFGLNGETYHLTTNNGVNHLHGGVVGFDRVVWNARVLSPKSVEFSYTSKDGEESYPGTLDLKVTFTVTEKNELKIDYAAQESPGKDTIVNLTNHSYFNLTGDPKNSILDHELMINSLRFTPTDAGQIPTGELRSVKNTPFDFTALTAIGARIDLEDEQLKMGKGYDQNWVINRKGSGLVLAAELYEPKSGRVMQVLTTEPGIQFYSGNNLNGTEKGKEGQAYAFRSGLALETQHYPDSPNHPDFPTTTLKDGQRYTSTTIYRFSAR